MSGSALAPRAAGLAVGCAALLSSSCGRIEDTVFVGVAVEFTRAAGQAGEHQSEASVGVRLSAPSSSPVVVHYAIVDGTASGHDDCGTRDHSATSGSVTIPAGNVEATLSLRQLDDDLPEPDEVLVVELVDAEGARLGAQQRYQHTIVDDDRSLLVDVVADFGARGDGIADDTAPLQAAIDRASLSSAAVVVFPPRDFLISQLVLAPGVSYFGYGATLRQAPAQPSDAQMVRLDHAGAEASSLVFIQGLTFDGQRDAQGPFLEWQYQDSQLLVLWGDPLESGQLRAVLEDLTFRNTGGSGVLLGPNTDSALCQINGDDVYTDLVKLGGGNATLSARAIVGDGSVGTTGIALTGEIPGYGDSRSVSVDLERVDLRTGDLEIDVEQGSEVIARRVDTAQAPFYLRAVRSRVHVADSHLLVGPPRFRFNRIVAPGDVRFDNSDIVVTEFIEPTLLEAERARELMLQVTWDDVDYASSAEEEDAFVETLTDQRLVFSNCRFHLADDVEAADTAFVVGSLGPADATNQLVIQGGSVAAGFDDVFAPGCGNCTIEP